MLQNERDSQSSKEGKHWMYNFLFLVNSYLAQLNDRHFIYFLYSFVLSTFSYLLKCYQSWYLVFCSLYDLFNIPSQLSTQPGIHGVPLVAQLYHRFCTLLLCYIMDAANELEGSNCTLKHLLQFTLLLTCPFCCIRDPIHFKILIMITANQSLH